MITDLVLDAARGVNSRLDEKAAYLKAVEGSPLHRLVSANITATTLMSVDGPGSILPDTTILTDSEFKGSDGVHQHDVVMEAEVAHIVETIQANMSLARNEVKPVIAELFEMYNKEMEYLTVDASSPVVVIPNIYHSFWGSPQLSGLVERFKNATLEPFLMPFPLPMMNVADIQGLIKTGIESVDSQITDWFENQDPEKVMATYNSVFVQRHYAIGRPTNAVHLVPESNLDRNDNLLVFLIANGLEDNLPDGVEVSLENIRSASARMREQAGRAVYTELKRRDSDRKARAMVYKVSSQEWKFSKEGRTVVYVNNDAYLDYLNEGGTVESIYGAIVGGNGRSPAALLEQREVNEKAWGRFYGMFRQRVSAEIYTAQRDAVRLAMTKYLNAQVVEDLPAPKDALQQRLMSCLSNLQPKSLENELGVVTQVVCKVLYADTNVEMVLLAMEEAKRKNPEYNGRECALLAEMDLLARWWASQMEICYE
jgi:hypothetical protein